MTQNSARPSVSTYHCVILALEILSLWSLTPEFTYFRLCHLQGTHKHNKGWKNTRTRRSWSPKLSADHRCFITLPLVHTLFKNWKQHFQKLSVPPNVQDWIANSAQSHIVFPTLHLYNNVENTYLLRCFSPSDGAGKGPWHGSLAIQFANWHCFTGLNCKYFCACVLSQCFTHSSSLSHKILPLSRK